MTIVQAVIGELGANSEQKVYDYDFYICPAAYDPDRTYQYADLALIQLSEPSSNNVIQLDNGTYYQPNDL